MWRHSGHYYIQSVGVVSHWILSLIEMSDFQPQSLKPQWAAWRADKTLHTIFSSFRLSRFLGPQNSKNDPALTEKMLAVLGWQIPKLFICQIIKKNEFKFCYLDTLQSGYWYSSCWLQWPQFSSRLSLSSLVCSGSSVSTMRAARRTLQKT